MTAPPFSGQSCALQFSARQSSYRSRTCVWPSTCLCQRELLISPQRHLVASRAVGGSTAAVACDDTGLLAIDVGVDTGHPGVDLVGEQADPKRLDVIGPCRHSRCRGLDAREAVFPRVADQTGYPINIVF